MSTTLILKTRSQAKYALVRTEHTKATYAAGVLTPGEFIDAKIIGYAYSTKHTVELRAKRLGAVILPIVDGKVEVTV